MDVIFAGLLAPNPSELLAALRLHPGGYAAAGQRDRRGDHRETVRRSGAGGGERTGELPCRPEDESAASAHRVPYPGRGAEQGG